MSIFRNVVERFTSIPGKQTSNVGFSVVGSLLLLLDASPDDTRSQKKQESSGVELGGEVFGWENR